MLRDRILLLIVVIVIVIVIIVEIWMVKISDKTTVTNVVI